MFRKTFALLLAFTFALAVAPAAGAGPVSGKVKRSGTVTWFLVPGEAGTGIPWPEGGELDAPGDLAGLSSQMGTEPHVALANVWTTAILEMPLTFESGPFTKATMMGGTVRVTAYLAEPTAAAVVGFVEARLFEVTPDGSVTPFASLSLDSEVPYTAGPTGPMKGTYSFGADQVWQIPKGNRLLLELDFTCFCSTLLRFFYGDATWAASLTLDRYVKVK